MDSTGNFHRDVGSSTASSGSGCDARRTTSYAKDTTSSRCTNGDEGIRSRLQSHLGHGNRIGNGNASVVDQFLRGRPESLGFLELLGVLRQSLLKLNVTGGLVELTFTLRFVHRNHALSQFLVVSSELVESHTESGGDIAQSGLERTAHLGEESLLISSFAGFVFREILLKSRDFFPEDALLLKLRRGSEKVKLLGILTDFCLHVLGPLIQ